MQFQTLTSLLFIALTIVTAHAAAAPGNLTLHQAAVKCPADAKCLTCTKAAKNQCGFDPDSLKCVIRKGGPSNLVTEANKELCRPLQQAVDVSKNQKVNNQAKALLAKMSKHIFEGEKTSKTSGRHTFSSWRAANKDAGRCDTKTKICAFHVPKKTVFDDRAEAYTRSDIETMCLIAIKINLLANGGKKDGAFVVQNKFAQPVCIRHQIAGQGSCYLLGIHREKSNLSKPCQSTGYEKIKGKTEEINA